MLLVYLGNFDFILNTLLLHGAGLSMNHPRSGAQSEIFQSMGGFVELGHFDKYFVKFSRKKGPPGKKIRSFFLLDTLKSAF